MNPLMIQLGLGVGALASLVTLYGTICLVRQKTDENFYPAVMSPHQVTSIVFAIMMWVFVGVYLLGNLLYYFLY